MPRFLHALFASRRDAPESFPVIPRGPPRCLRLETGVFPAMRGVRYAVSRGTLTRIRHGIHSQSNRCEPAPEEWNEFWIMVERLGVRHWRADYQQPRQLGEFTLDGNGWCFRLRAGSVNTNSCGRAAYPSISAPHRATSSPSALLALQAELNHLLDDPPAPIARRIFPT